MLHHLTDMFLMYSETVEKNRYIVKIYEHINFQEIPENIIN